ncbi:MAG: PilZ domain-containing protein [Deltaproteobacteria bacterium]|nr:PilZ domain-containing protein [Deltaproteobacteria bacterium]
MLISAEEKRLSLRRKWRAKIVFEDEFGEGILYLYSKDISLGGLFLETPPPLKLGAHLFLSFLLPGEKRPLKMTGQVVRLVDHDKGGGLHTGAGIRFTDLDMKTFKILSGFVRESSKKPG